MSAAPKSSEEPIRPDFDDLYVRHQRAILAYTSRRTASGADAEDAAAETFIVAWRRLGSAPVEPLPWLYGIARRVLANQRRAGDRRMRLMDRIRSQPQDVPTPHAASAEAPAMMALRSLRTDDQEVLRLVAWEGLRHAEIAVVLGISVNAVGIRLHRARTRFATELDRVTLKGSGADRTSDQVKGRPFGRRRQEDET